MFRKWICVLCALCMLPILSLAQEALPKNFDISLGNPQQGDQEYIEGFAPIANDLYLLTNKGIYFLAEGKQECESILTFSEEELEKSRGKFKENPSPIISCLLSDGESLYDLRLRDNQIVPFSIENGKLQKQPPIKIDVDEFAEKMEGGEDDGWKYFHTSYIGLTNDILTIMFLDYSSMDDQQKAVSFDLKTGEKKRHEVPFIKTLCTYKDGKFLVAQGDGNNAWNPETGEVKAPTVAVYDPADGTITELGSLSNIKSFDERTILLHYDAKKDDILYATESKVFRLHADGTEELCAYLPIMSYSRMNVVSSVLLPNDTICTLRNDKVCLRSTDPAAVPDFALTILGSDAQPAFESASSLMPEVPIISKDKWYQDAQQLYAMLTADQEPVDILVLSCDRDFYDSLLAKGYAANLSGSTVISDYVAKAYPEIREKCELDNQVLAIPIDISAQGMAYNEQAFKTLGIDPPTTFVDFCDFIINWEKDYADEHPDFQLFDYNTVFENIKRHPVFLNTANLLFKGEQVRLDTPEFRQMMQKMEKIDRRSEEEELNWRDRDAVEEHFSKTFLFSEHYWFDLRHMSHVMSDEFFDHKSPETFLPLRASEETPSIVVANLRVLLVNSKSRHLDAAIRFAENYARSISEETSRMLQSKNNAPIENPYYEESLKSIQKSIERLEKDIEKAEGAERTEMGKAIEHLKKLLANPDILRYEVSSEGIAAYRKMMEHMVIKTSEFNLMGDHENFSQLFDRYFDGQLPLENLIQETDSKLRLMYLERQ